MGFPGNRLREKKLHGCYWAGSFGKHPCKKVKTNPAEGEKKKNLMPDAGATETPLITRGSWSWESLSERFQSETGGWALYPCISKSLAPWRGLILAESISQGQEQFPVRDAAVSYLQWYLLQLGTATCSWEGIWAKTALSTTTSFQNCHHTVSTTSQPTFSLSVIGWIFPISLTFLGKAF